MVQAWADKKYCSSIVQADLSQILKILISTLNDTFSRFTLFVSHRKIGDPESYLFAKVLSLNELAQH
jgi:hypothetical protein